MNKKSVMGKQTRREFLKMTGFAAASAGATSLFTSCANTGQIIDSPALAVNLTGNPPNIIFILADDLGYGDLGCYGQEQIATPNIDRMAAEGMRFTDHYAGSTVCAPSRCALMVGQHTGHCLVRGNGRVPLRPSDFTVAEMLKEAGYATGIIGKWGLGEPETTGIPNKQGFDYWFGYLNQRHAHNYYPEYLWRNEEKVELANEVNHVIGGQDRTPGGVATKRVEYSHDLFAEEALNFVEKHKDRPFFLYLALTIPHANNEARYVNQHGMEVPDYGIYTNKDWPEPQKGHAAMITRMDSDIGRLMATLKALGLDDNTLVMFSSDNGPHKEGQADPAFFKSSGSLRGYKRALYEGGIRVPMIARWPGRIMAGSVSDHISAFWDFLPTCAELIDVRPPEDIDGISMAPILLGRLGRQKKHEFLYWEFHEQGKKQAVRAGDWKGVRLNVARDPDGPIELYNLRDDIGETRNVAGRHPEIVAKIEEYMMSARTPSEHWPLP
ncbi:MAG: arylsulfatase [Planctomycetota bacterium]